jgi:iron(III) transport system substrate-binding protein
MGHICRNSKWVLALVAGLGLIASGFPVPSTWADSIRDQMIEKAKKEGEFVVAGSNADTFRDELKGFTKRYPFITLKAFTANTGDTINRVTAEAKAGKLSFDLPAVSSDGLELLSKAGLLEKMDFPHLKDIPADTQPTHGRYLQLFLNPRVQGAYNTQIVSPKDAPKTWEAMLDPKWAGKTMISRSSEDIPAQLAYLWGEGGNLNWERSFDFFSKLLASKPLIARGYRGGMKRLSAGEAGIFWFSAVGPAARDFDNGAPLGLIAFPKFTGTFRSFGVLKGAQHPASAWLFIDYLSSPEGQLEYTEVISAKVPVNNKAKVGKLGKWLVAQNATVENTVPLDAQVVFDTKVQKKSETFFLKLIGVK